MTVKRRTTLLMLLALTLAVVLGGCSNAGAKNYVPGGGVDARDGGMVVDDAWIEGLHRLPAGSDTGLRLYLANDSAHPDALTGVSVPLATRARLVLDGRPVDRIPVAAGGARDLEWDSRGDGVELIVLKHAVKPGQWFDATFRFAHSPPIRTQITVAPLGGDFGAHSAGTPTGRSALVWGHARPGRRG